MVAALTMTTTIYMTKWKSYIIGDVAGIVLDAERHSRHSRFNIERIGRMDLVTLLQERLVGSLRGRNNHPDYKESPLSSNKTYSTWKILNDMPDGTAVQ